jgi:predicted extracellular nuclease
MRIGTYKGGLVPGEGWALFRGYFRRLIIPIVWFTAGLLIWTASWDSQTFPSGPEEIPRGIPLVSICKIQGGYFRSPYEGKTLRTQGVVYADLDTSVKRGFYLQSDPCDGDPSTSDGVFVYLGERIDVVKPGDLVEVTGIVQEYFGTTEISISAGDILLLSADNPLPLPAELFPPLEESASSRYFEALEGMYVRMDDAVVVGPTNESDETWVVRADLGIGRVFREDPRGIGEILCVDDGGIFEISPEAKVGDRVTNLTGALDYAVGVYRLQLFAPPVLTPGPAILPEDEVVRPAGVFSFTVATFNLADFFDTYDDPAVDDTVLSAAEYQRRLRKRALAIHTYLGEPEIIAVQEAENLSVLQALVLRSEVEADYGIIFEDGPDERGIDTALLYRTDRVQVIGYQVRQTCTGLMDGFGPDGNRDTADPQNLLTCDLDGDGEMEGNRLFSRPPMIVRLRICESGCQQNSYQEERQTELWLLANHWKSKTEDSPINQFTLPRRIEQAQFTAGLVQEILSAAPGANFLLLGDLNDYPDSQPLSIVKSLGLENLLGRADSWQRYTYIHQGVSQQLDYILAGLNPTLAAYAAASIHINTDFPTVFEDVSDTAYRSSDHDALLARFIRYDHYAFLPYILPFRTFQR